jgi:hypothetical protein
MRSWWIAVVALGFGATPRLAHAQEAAKTPSEKVSKPSADKHGESDDEPAERPISVSLLGGYGQTFNANDDLNPLGIGFGVRGGYSFGALYLGLRFLFFLGDSERMDGAGVSAEVSASTLTVGLEGGYDLALAADVLVLRPELGVGLGIVEGESIAGGAMLTADGSSEDLYIAPGVALLVNVGERSIIGLDLQAPIVFADDIEVALTMLAVAGMHF